MKQPSVYLKMRVLGAIDTCPLPRSDPIFVRMLPNWDPRVGCLLQREFGKEGRPSKFGVQVF